jgi:hypothetical protein
VVDVTARDAFEARLALAASRINDTARGACLACVMRRHCHDMTAAFFHFVRQDGRELMPPRIEDRAVQARFLADVSPWLSDGAAS